MEVGKELLRWCLGRFYGWLWVLLGLVGVDIQKNERWLRKRQEEIRIYWSIMDLFEQLLLQLHVSLTYVQGKQ